MKHSKIVHSDNSDLVTVLTHELGANYGGILQAFALQKALVVFGKIPSTSWIEPGSSLVRRVRRSLSASLKSRSVVVITPSIDKTIQSNTDIFLKTHLNIAASISPHAYKNKSLLKTHSIVVGSDQVWRKAYVNPVLYMLGFVTDQRISRISYAASFGKDDLKEYNDDEVKKTADLSRSFAGLSVRETSGVGIIKKYWKSENGLVHIDPTLLLKRSIYTDLADNDTQASAGDIFVYVLDRSDYNNRIITSINNVQKGVTFELLPEKLSFYMTLPRNRSRLALPGVNQWLRSFIDAKYVITDSFHGTVFSIIFNKPFIAIGNKNRGLARFTSLLQVFGLEDRLVTSAEEVTEDLIRKPIDWVSVNAKIKSEQKRSFDYLKKYLG